MAEHENPPVEHVENRLEFETLLSDVSSRFINLSSNEVDHEIEDALRRVCEHVDIDYAVLWQFSVAQSGVLTPTHFYPLQDGREPANPLFQEQYPWVVEQMLAGRLVSIASLEELPAEAVVDRENARLSGIKSNLCLPMTVGGAPFVGALAFNTLRAECDWPKVLVKRLQMVAEVFTNALARKGHELSLKESEERLALAADSAEAGLWTLDFSTGAFWATQRGRTIFGYPPDEVISMERFEVSILPDDRDLVQRAIARSVHDGEPVDVEYRIIHPDHDHVRWIASRGRPRLAPSGELLSLMGVSIDITDRRRTEEAHFASQDRLAAAAELAGLGFYEVDFGQGAMYIEDRLRELCGIPPDREQGLQTLEFWMEHLHPDDLQRIMHKRDQLHDGRLDRFSVEYRYMHPSRGELWIHHLAGASERDVTECAVRTFGVLRDITDRKRSEEELRDLSQRLIRAHEEERALLARELHDDVTQRLAVLAIEAGSAEFAAPEGAQAAVMRRIREGLISLSEDVHSLAYQLHPSVLDELGLPEALRTECERRSRQSRLDLSAEIDPLPAAIVGRDAALCLFRVAQEALNNISRHAGAHAACVELRLVDEGLLLAVRDDGVGFDPASPEKRRSLGLASMRERVRLANGTLDIDSSAGCGTSIVAWVPTKGGSR